MQKKIIKVVGFGPEEKWDTVKTYKNYNLQMLDYKKKSTVIPNWALFS